MVPQFYKFAKKHSILYLNLVNFTICLKSQGQGRQGENALAGVLHNRDSFTWFKG